MLPFCDLEKSPFRFDASRLFAWMLAFFAKFCKFLAGSFSAVSKQKFARKYAFDSIFKLYKICILLHRCNLNILAKNRFEKLAIFVKIQQKFCKYRKICKMLPDFKNFSLIIW